MDTEPLQGKKIIKYVAVFAAFCHSVSYFLREAANFVAFLALALIISKFFSFKEYLAFPKIWIYEIVIICSKDLLLPQSNRIRHLSPKVPRGYRQGDSMLGHW